MQKGKEKTVSSASRRKNALLAELIRPSVRTAKKLARVGRDHNLFLVIVQQMLGVFSQESQASRPLMGITKDEKMECDVLFV